MATAPRPPVKLAVATLILEVIAIGALCFPLLGTGVQWFDLQLTGGLQLPGTVLSDPISVNICLEAKGSLTTTQLDFCPGVDIATGLPASIQALVDRYSNILEAYSLPFNDQDALNTLNALPASLLVSGTLEFALWGALIAKRVGYYLMIAAAAGGAFFALLSALSTLILVCRILGVTEAKGASRAASIPYQCCGCGSMGNPCTAVGLLVGSMLVVLLCGVAGWMACIFAANGILVTYVNTQLGLPPPFNSLLQVTGKPMPQTGYWVCVAFCSVIIVAIVLASVTKNSYIRYATSAAVPRTRWETVVAMPAGSPGHYMVTQHTHTQGGGFPQPAFGGAINVSGSINAGPQAAPGSGGGVVVANPFGGAAAGAMPVPMPMQQQQQGFVPVKQADGSMAMVPVGQQQQAGAGMGYAHQPQQHHTMMQAPVAAEQVHVSPLAAINSGSQSAAAAAADVAAPTAMPGMVPDGQGAREDLPGAVV